MNELVVHAITQQQLDDCTAHALLLVGPEGIGRTALAMAFAQAKLQLSGQKPLEKYPYFRLISAEDSGSISIDAIRPLQQFTKLKIASSANDQIQRVIILEQAHTMAHEAQNALLKLLEEPPADTLFVLTAASDQQLLPTIRSRSQIISVQRPSEKSIVEYFTAHGLEPAKIHQAYLMSGGLPGLMQALLAQADHPLAGAATQARTILQASPFERLVTVDALAKQKADCRRVLAILQQMALVALEQTAAKESTNANTNVMRRWQRILATSSVAESALASSAQPKLVLTNFMLALG